MESNNNDFGKSLRNLGLFIGLPLLVVVVIWLFMSGDTKKSDKVYSDYLAYFYNDQVKSFDLDLGTSNLTITLKEELREDRNKDNKLDEKDDIIKYRVPNVSLFLEDVKDYRSLLVKNGNTYDYQPQSQMPWFFNLIPSLLIIVFFVAMFVMMRRSLSSMDGGGKAMGFGKARIKQPVDEKRKTTFADVAGADEEKEELREIVDFLRSPKNSKSSAPGSPKGCCWWALPVRARPCWPAPSRGRRACPSSPFQAPILWRCSSASAHHVSVICSTRRKRIRPCIIFIDEIDAVGRQRGAGLGGGHDEREQTLNQLLVEMDGFGANSGVIVIAATNRADILDPALMRPGRFDRQIVVNYPDVKGREEILKVHARGKASGPRCGSERHREIDGRLYRRGSGKSAQ